MALGSIPKERKRTMNRWTDDMIREYFDTHWNATIHEICALSGRTKADVKRALMQGAGRRAQGTCPD